MEFVSVSYVVRGAFFRGKGKKGGRGEHTRKEEDKPNNQIEK
jgi:hypothetical protein